MIYRSTINARNAVARRFVRLCAGVSLALLGAALASGRARAADMPDNYLRGDLGYNWGRIQGAQSATPFPSPTDNELNGAAMAGFGAGIKTQTAARLDIEAAIGTRDNGAHFL